MSERPEIHVVPMPDGRWGLRLAGETDVTSAHGTRKAAIEAGRKRPGTAGAMVVIHDETGRISDRPGHGPHPRRASKRQPG